MVVYVLARGPPPGPPPAAASAGARPPPTLAPSTPNSNILLAPSKPGPPGPPPRMNMLGEMKAQAEKVSNHSLLRRSLLKWESSSVS